MPIKRILFYGGLAKEEYNETKVDIGDVDISLYYAYNINGGNYKVIPFAEIEDELTNYKEYYDKYKELLTKDNNNIKFYNIGD